MTEITCEYKTAVISDRGLSEKRPLNEDSYYADNERGLFAVADGVGGANAGEVASQTAMEVLSEAFRHHLPDTDNEDLMELAIQRANSSIYQMSREHPKLSMMATTIVALHLNGLEATLGHVGDSRIYRLTPDGRLFRETLDHSVVEEEVRAGRMTPEQAATHPSRNVISRALGAEESVEVDMKTMLVPEGTTFLLCSDGVTRHIKDDELGDILVSHRDLDSVCQTLKSICYERGAEDNLTAVLVRVQRVGAAQQTFDEEEERTVSSARVATATTVSLDDYRAAAAGASQPYATAQAPSQPIASVASPATTYAEPPTASAADQSLVTGSAQYAQPAYTPAHETTVTFEEAPSKKRSVLGMLVKWFLFLLLLLAVAAGSFYAGMLFKERNPSGIWPRTSGSLH
jgi:protein phosphatase